MCPLLELIFTVSYHFGAHRLSLVRSRVVFSSHGSKYTISIGRAIRGIRFVRCTEVVCFSESAIRGFNVLLWSILIVTVGQWQCMCVCVGGGGREMGSILLYVAYNITSGDENHLCGVSLRESHKISLKEQRHRAWGPTICQSVEATIRVKVS